MAYSVVGLNGTVQCCILLVPQRCLVPSLKQLLHLWKKKIKCGVFPVILEWLLKNILLLESESCLKMLMSKILQMKWILSVLFLYILKVVKMKRRPFYAICHWGEKEEVSPGACMAMVLIEKKCLNCFDAGFGLIDLDHTEPDLHPGFPLGHISVAGDYLWPLYSHYYL